MRWQEGGLNLDNAEHAQYIAEVSANLTKQLTSTIDTIIEEHQNKVVTVSLMPKFLSILLFSTVKFKAKRYLE